jgi:hypothetical protein
VGGDVFGLTKFKDFTKHSTGKRVEKGKEGKNAKKGLRRETEIPIMPKMTGDSAFGWSP